MPSIDSRYDTVNVSEMPESFNLGNRFSIMRLYSNDLNKKVFHDRYDPRSKKPPCVDLEAGEALARDFVAAGFLNSVRASSKKARNKEDSEP